MTSAAMASERAKTVQLPRKKSSVVTGKLNAPVTEPSETYLVVSQSSRNSPQPTAAMRQSSSSKSVPLQRMPLPPLNE